MKPYDIDIKLHQSKLIQFGLIALVLFGLLALFSFESTRKNLEKGFLRNLQNMEAELSIGVITHDREYVEKVATTLYQQLDGLEVRDTEHVIYSLPSETENIGATTCHVELNVPLLRYSQVVGHIKACITRSTIIRSAFLSPTLFGYLLLVVLTGAALAMAPLFAYRRSLLRVLTSLEKWSANTQERLPESKVPHVGADLIEEKLLELVNRGILERLRHEDTRVAYSNALAISSIASQVAHDIRSPLAALSMAERDLAALPEDTRLIIRSAIGRIQDIASQLMLMANAGLPSSGTATPGRDEAQAPSEPTLLSAVIETILAEKRMQYRARLGIKIESAPSPEAQALFAAVQPREFKRVISNLINNAVEAIPNSGHVTLSLEPSHDQKFVTLRIRDTGKGIPGDIMEKLGTRGFSYKKEGGSGLGLHHARTSLESWGGTFGLQSEPGTGTEVALTLPLSEPPAWFQNLLELESGTQVVVLDDDQSIHQVWQGRVESAAGISARPRLLHFSTPTHLREWYEARSPEERNLPAQYLIDFEILGSSETGLDLIESLGIAAQSVLVTSRYEEPTIRARCQAIGLKLLPKALAGFVPLTLQAPPQTIDAILIDDDSLVHTTWNLMARRHGKNLRSFTSVEALRTELDQIPKDTPIYIDSNLGKGIQGEDLLQELSRLGYQHLVLATGYESGAFLKKLTGTAGFKGVRDKTPPWAG
jgi:signal transduction histidine kinase